MFSTILTEVSKYFNQRTLVSAFFPAFAFWGVTVALAVHAEPGWTPAFAWWKANGTTAQAFLLLLAFFLWVTFWSFLTLSYHGALLRLYEGRWPIPSLAAAERARWQGRFDASDRRDRELEMQEIALADAKRALEDLRAWIAEQPPGPGGDDVGAAAAALDEALPAFAATVAALRTPQSVERVRFPAMARALLAPARPPQDNATAGTAHPLTAPVDEARRLWVEVAPWLALVEGDLRWAERVAALEKLTANLEQLVDRAYAEVEERRLALNHEIFLLFPAQRDDVMPTQLGNVLKAVQSRVWLRFQIDAVLVWSRLQPLLPKESADPVSDARTSLDLMLTLSASALLFGIPLSVCAAVSGAWTLLWWTPGVLLGLALLVNQRIPVLLAILVMVLEIVRLAASPQLLEKTQFFLGAVTALLLFAWITYRTAVQAALAYGEKIQAGFDLHRWKVFEGMNLQLPPNLQEEREMWKQLSALLARGYTPEPAYFTYIRDDKKTKSPAAPPPVTLCVPVPVRALPPFRVIVAADVTLANAAPGEVPADAAPDAAALVGKWPLAPLLAEKPVPLSVLADTDPLVGHRAVGLDASSELVLGGALKPGARVDVTFVANAPPLAALVGPPIEPALPPVPAATYSDLLVLDAQPAEGGRYVLSLALPADLQVQFAERKAGGTLFVARRA